MKVTWTLGLGELAAPGRLGIAILIAGAVAVGV
jgi:hypothetical protein